MAFSDVNWAHKDPTLIEKLNQMVDNSVWTAEHRIMGGEIAITGTSTVEVHPLRLDIGGVWLQEETTANLILTAETNGDWREGTSQEVTSTAFYVFAYNSNSTVAVKFCLSAPAYSDTSSATSIGPKMYDKSGSTWFRCVGAVLNDTGADAGSLRRYFQCGNIVRYDQPVNIISNSITGAWSAAVDCSSIIPKISKYGYFGGKANHAGGGVRIWIRPNGGSAPANDENAVFGHESVGGKLESFTDGDRQIQHQEGALDDNGVIDIDGYRTEIR